MAHKVTDPVVPVVICNQLIRDAIVVKDDEGAVDPEKTQQEVEWHEITCLSFSYKGATHAPACCGRSHATGWLRVSTAAASACSASPRPYNVSS